LQAVEDDLIAAGKRHATIQGITGVFEWFETGADASPAEETQADIQEIEDMIVTQGWDDIVVAASRGTFIWKRRG
jgi:hypothetical protein